MVVKKQLILVCVAAVMIILMGGCSKNKGCNPNPPSTEASQIVSYAMANNLTLTAHSSGLFYQIIDPGNGPTASLYSKIVITYTGKLLNGTVFDHQDLPNPDAIALSRFIEGWRIGIPMIQKGGRIILLIPSALGFGCEGRNAVQGNSTLYYDVQLVDVQ